MLFLRNPNGVNTWHYLIKNCLNEKSLEVIDNFRSITALKKAEMFNADNDASRLTDISFLELKEDTVDLYQNVGDLIEKANLSHFNWQLLFLETMQYSEYPVGGTYCMHTDSGLKGDKGLNRKLSFSILLSDPLEYEGGDLELYQFNEPEKIKMNKNDIVFFPSFTPHRVTPVTKGKRISLVGWVVGPNFV